MSRMHAITMAAKKFFGIRLGGLDAVYLRTKMAFSVVYADVCGKKNRKMSEYCDNLYPHNLYVEMEEDSCEKGSG